MKTLSPKLKIITDNSSPISLKKDISNTYHIQTYSPHRKSPLIRSNSNEKTMSPKSYDSNPMTKTEELLFEDTFRGMLGSLKRILLQYQPHQDSNSSRDSRIEEHAQELINEELRRTTNKMQNLQINGSTYLDSKSHKIAAYSFLSAQLIDDIENILAQHDSMEALEKLRDQHDQVIQQYKALQNHSSYDKAILEQRVLLLEEENKSLKEQVSLLSRKKGTLVFELETRNRMEDDAHAKYVQLHIQIVNYHTKINQLMNSLEAGVKTRIGFLPRDIQSHIDKVRNLPAPGADILYTRRNQRSKSTELLRSKSLNSSDEIISSPAATSSEIKDDFFSPPPSIEKMSQKEFYKQLNKDHYEILSPQNKNQRNNFELNHSESFNTIDSQFNNNDNDFNSFNNNNDNDNSNISGTLHEKYDKYFQMKKNLIINSQLKESQSDLHQSNLSPVGDPHYHQNYQTRNKNNDSYEDNRTIHVVTTPISPSLPSSSTPDIKYYTTPMTEKS